MTKTIKALLITLVMVTAATNSTSQISEKGTPPSFKYTTTNTIQTRNNQKLPPYTINPEFTTKQLIEEDQNAPEGTPCRIGILLAAGLEFPKDAERTILPEGEEIYRLRIKSEGATALSLYYNQFKIPEDGKLYIYNNDHTQLLGAYTPITNPDGGAFSSQFIAGDDITIEYAVPASGALPQIEISEIGYGYNHLEIRSNTTNLSCMVNINCPEGDNWQDEKEGVIKMTTRSGSSIYTSSASMLNNTGNTPTPYIYTAFHCIQAGTRQFTESELQQTQFIFHYENTDCTGEETSEYKTLIGCKHLASSSLSGGYDQALLLLTSEIPDDLNPYLCGWDKTENTPQNGAGIHHPNGETKKISTYTTLAKQGTWATTTAVGAANGHWIIQFTQTQSGHSVTASGSSGSPLFNENHKVVGSLTGGNSSCSNPNGSNYYGKISKFFNRISGYLDPDNTGANNIEGRYWRNKKPVPQNLTATYDPTSKGAQLTWSAPGEEAPVSYTIYRNGYEIDRTAATTYTEASLYPGLHEYTVTAQYQDGTISEKSTPAALRTHITAPPAEIETKRTGEKEIQISWEAPLPEQPIYWGKGKVDSQYKANTLPLYIGQKWNTSDLEEVNQYTINKIEYYSIAGAEYELYIKNGNRTYSEKVTATTTNKTITKQIPPFAIDATQELICGLKITGGNNYQIASDNYEAPVGHETLFSTDGNTWETTSTFTHNLYIKAHITPPTSNPENATAPDENATAKAASSRPVAAATPTYTITRNGTQIANNISNNNNTYTDTELEQGTEYTYTVTADYGDEGTASTTAAPFLLKAESFDADIKNLTVNGTEIPSGENGTYIAALPCGTPAATITITAHPQATITINGETGRTTTIETEAGGRYDIDITVTSESGENNNTYHLQLYKLPENIILKRWNDILVVINNPDNNGGLQFSSYKWYINGQATNCTEQHMYLPGGISTTDTYTVELITDDGITLTSCPQTFPSESNDIRLYPTFVGSEAEMNLYIKTDDKTRNKPTTLYITDMNGRTTTRQVTGSDNTIKAPHTEGTYIIKVVTPDGKTAEFKIRVKN